MRRHNVQIQNDQNSTYMHKRGSSTIALVLTRVISNLKCQAKEFDLINTCHKGIITTSLNIRLIINNKKYKTKGANWNAWKTDLTSSLNKYLNSNVTLNSKSTIDLLIWKLTKIINDTAQKSLGIIKNSSLSKSWWNNQLTEAYKEYTETRKTYTYRATPANHKKLKSSKKTLQELIDTAKKHEKHSPQNI